MNSSNPILRPEVLDAQGRTYDATGSMTVQGATNKVGLLLVLSFLTACLTWNAEPATMQGALLFGSIIGLVAALVTMFKPAMANITAPIYAVAQGAALGGLTSIFNMQWPGIAVQAISLTFGVLATMLVLYRTGVIKVTEKFRLGVFAATGAIALVYLVSMVLGFFGVTVPFLHQPSAMGIGISCVIVGVAALNLVLDFDFIEQGARNRAPKVMEWYAAFGLMVTLIWLYVEILRLLSMLSSRRD